MESGLMSQHEIFVWNELVTPDQEKSGKFYSELFGWTRKEVETEQYGIYTLFQKDGEDIAGMMNPTHDTPGEGAYWHAYLAVEDVDECAQSTLDLGGKVLVPPQDIPGVGRICVISDPTGAVMHLMTLI